MKKDLDYHTLLHQRLGKSEVIFSDRILSLEKFNKKICKFHGNILDIGCGNGYASIYLLKTFPSIKKVFLLENSLEAVNNLIPSALNEFGLIDKGKYEIINGSFDNIKLNTEFDFVISFGAIHHSDCLFKTIENLKKITKKNGYLILNEPSKDDTTTHENYIKKYNSIEIKEGIKMKNKERNDHFYRNCEYKSALILNGFDIIYQNKISKSLILKYFKKICFLAKLSKLRNINFFQYIIFKIYKKLKKKAKKTEQNHNSNNKIIVDKNVYEYELFLRKSFFDEIPHLWSKLK